MKICLDVDGVLACFFKAYETLIVKITGVDRFPAQYPIVLPPCWNWPQYYGYSNEEIQQVWQIIEANPEFWGMLEPLSGMEEAVRLSLRPKNDLYFITDRPGLGAKEITARWLQTQGIGWPSVLISSKGKGVICAALNLDVYVDDKAENILGVQAQSLLTRAYLISYPYNEWAQNDIFRVVGSLEDVFRRESLNLL